MYECMSVRVYESMSACTYMYAYFMYLRMYECMNELSTPYVRT